MTKSHQLILIRYDDYIILKRKSKEINLRMQDIVHFALSDFCSSLPRKHSEPELKLWDVWADLDKFLIASDINAN